MLDIFKSAALKFDAEFMDLAYSVAYVHSDENIRWHLRRVFPEVCEQMKNRVRVGECRYEAPRWQFLDADQEREIGPDWRCGFGFFDMHRSDVVAGARRKLEAYQRSGNLEFLIDHMNYLAFQHIRGDDEEMQLARAVALALIEYALPLHPRWHFKAADQGIDGTDYSGSLNTAEYARKFSATVAR